MESLFGKRKQSEKYVHKGLVQPDQLVLQIGIRQETIVADHPKVLVWDMLNKLGYHLLWCDIEGLCFSGTVVEKFESQSSVAPIVTKARS